MTSTLIATPDPPEETENCDLDCPLCGAFCCEVVDMLIDVELPFPERVGGPD